MKFTCNNYIEGAINKYVNDSCPHMIPLFTYYASGDQQESELKKQFDVRYGKPDGYVPAVVTEKAE